MTPEELTNELNIQLRRLFYAGYKEKVEIRRLFTIAIENSFPATPDSQVEREAATEPHRAAQSHSGAGGGSPERVSDMSCHCGCGSRVVRGMYHSE